MTAEELAQIVQQMRTAQKTWFKDKDQGALQEAKRLERMVDRCCEIILAEQKELF